MSDVDEVDCEFVRVSFSSRGSRSIAIERSQSSRRKSVAPTSGEWRPAERRFLLRKVNASTYNFMAKFRRVFGSCCRSITTDKRSQIVLLGQTYDGDAESSDLWNDIHSRLYLSYRTGFAPLKNSRVEIRSDTGWGCTIRTAQMLVAEGLVRHLLNRNYRRAQATTLEHRTIEAIQRLFYDEPSAACPLSIHHLTAMAFREFGKKPGQWYNPSMVGHVLYKAVNQHQASSDGLTASQLNDLCVYVARDGCIFLQDLVELCQPKNSNHVKWRAPLILIALRLGIESIRSAYYECLQRVLENPYSIGFVGGRENSSYFFVGYQDDQLLYLDPHYLQGSQDREAEHYFAKEVKRMRFKNLQPSCLLGFYCRDQDELGEFLKSVKDDVSAIESESGKAFRLFDICVGSANCLESGKLLSRNSMGSLEILSLFEQRDKMLKQVAT